MHTAGTRHIVVVDTNVVSYLWRRDNVSLVDFYERELADVELVVSFMTSKELRAGMLNGNMPTRMRTEWLAEIDEYEVVYPNEELVNAAAELQHLCGSQRPSEADLWIAATAYMLDCRLATEDQKLVNQVRGMVEVISTRGA